MTENIMFNLKISILHIRKSNYQKIQYLKYQTTIILKNINIKVM